MFIFEFVVDCLVLPLLVSRTNMATVVNTSAIPRGRRMIASLDTTGTSPRSPASAAMSKVDSDEEGKGKVLEAAYSLRVPSHSLVQSDLALRMQ